MIRASWNGQTIAESENCVAVEGNQYFPPQDVKKDFLKDSSTTTVCGWKGTANYYSLAVDGQTNEDAAWVYRDPKPEAQNIKDYIAFWKGVEVSEPAPNAAEGPVC